MKKYARGDGRRGVDSFVGKVSEFRKYLSERRAGIQEVGLLVTYNPAIKSGFIILQ